jgi:hypothetical protein
LCVGGLALTGGAHHAFGQITVDGTLDSDYGSSLTTQTINTGFGNSTFMGTSNGTADANGSELDAAYGKIENGNLYLFLSGNLENNGNLANIFIDDGAANGQSTLDVASGTTSAMNGSKFSPGFSGNIELDINDYYGNVYVNETVLNATTPQNEAYLGFVSLTSGVGHGTVGGISIGLNNTNVSTMGASGAATSASAADAVNTGLEIGIPLSSLGNPTGAILALADINNSNDNYLSNQFLPGLPNGTANLGTSTFDFSATAGQYFTVPAAPIPNGDWIQPNSGSWGTPANWSNAYVPHVAGDAANFAGATATSTVTLDGARSVGSMSFDSSGYSYTIAAGSGGALTFDNGSSAATLTDYAGAHIISANAVLNSNTTVSVINFGDSVTFSGNISGAGGLTVTNPGDGDVIVSGTNNYGGGTTVTAGNLQLASATALPTGTALTLGALDVPSGNLDLNGNNATVSSITVLTGPQTIPTGAVAQIINTSAAAVTATLTYAGTVGNPSTYSGNINDSSGSGGSTTALTVSSGSLTLTGTDTYAGTTTIASGATLVFASTGGTAYPSGGNTVNNGSLEVNDTVSAGSITGSGGTTVDSAMSLTALNLSQAKGLVNNGSATVLAGGTVGPITGTGTLTVSGGTLQIAAGTAGTYHPHMGGSSQDSLIISAGATLDITNNHIFINYGSGTDPISSIAAWIKSGYAGGAWTGTGIVSSTARTNHSYGIGYADSTGTNPAGLSSGQIEIMYTLLGDANLDGKVNGTDFTILATNFNQSVTDGWEKGDFNNDGKVNGTDFLALASNFNQSAGQSAVSGADLAAVDSFAAANGISLTTTSVPEPASLGLLTLGIVGTLARRRRPTASRGSPA